AGSGICGRSQFVKSLNPVGWAVPTGPSGSWAAPTLRLLGGGRCPPYGYYGCRWAVPTLRHPHPFLYQATLGPFSTKLAADVLLRVLLLRRLEDRLGIAVLDEVAGAAALRCIDVQKRRLVRDALGLLQIVRDNGDREPFLEVLHQVLDLA